MLEIQKIIYKIFKNYTQNLILFIKFYKKLLTINKNQEIYFLKKINFILVFFKFLTTHPIPLPTKVGRGGGIELLTPHDFF